MKGNQWIIALTLALGLVLALLWVLVDQNSPAVAAPLAPESGANWDGLGVSVPMVISGTGKYQMWYQGKGPSFYGWGFALGYAESPDGVNWGKYAGNPVLEPGETGEWDGAYRGQVAVIKDGATYKMWYSGGASTGPWQTGYATSTDGVEWDIYAGNQVLEAGGPGSWDEQDSDGPTVIKDGATYKMWYHGCNADYSVCSIGYATSPDGVNWTKYAGNAVLEQIPGQWDESGLGWPRVIKNGATYEMWYHSDGKLGYATSPDGVAWTKYAGNPVLSEGWDAAGVGVSTLLLDDATYKMWTTSGAGATRGIGYFESSDGIHWTQLVSNPLLQRGQAGVIIDVTYVYNRVEARTLGNTPITITVSGAGGVKATISGVTDSGGRYYSWEHDENWSPERPDILPGDTVSATTPSYSTIIETVGEVEAQTHNDTDLVEGTIHAPWFAPDSLSVLCEVYDPSVALLDADVPADGGSFECDFSGLADITGSHEGYVGYLEPDGDVVSVSFRKPVFLSVNYTQEWVCGDTMPFATVAITVADSGGGIKATSSGQADWTGEFWTPDWVWNPPSFNIVPGDAVTATVEGQMATVNPVGEIEAEANACTDVVAGAIHAPWFAPQTLNIKCFVWGHWPAPRVNISGVAADGGTYVCHFRGLWDIQLGDQLGVSYVEPDGDSVAIFLWASPCGIYLPLVLRGF